MTGYSNIEHALRTLAQFNRQAGAFGDPEGTRADLDHFVRLPSHATADLLLERDALQTRVVVGRKGSGKTFYLRKLRDQASQDDAVIAEAFEKQNYLPGTRHVDPVATWYDEENAATRAVTELGDWYPEDLLTEIWMLVWNRAIWASLASRVLYSTDLRPHVDREDRGLVGRIAQNLRMDLRLSEVERSVFSFVKQFIDSVAESERHNPHTAGRELQKMLDDIVWDDLERAIERALLKSPPIFMYIDAIDEEFHHQPMRWLRCQKGLFYTTMRMLRSDTHLAGRLHVVISIRDIVLSSVLKSEHATRYVSSPYIRSLSWDGSSIRSFLTSKVRDLVPSAWFPERPRPADLSEWLGLTSVTLSNGEPETVEDFALRHTQVLPRDVVLLGNYLGKEVERARSEGRSRLTEKEVRGVVESVGVACGLTQVVTAVNQARSEGAAGRGPLVFLERQRAADEYVEPAQILIEIIRSVGGLRFERSALEAIRRRGKEVFSCDDLPSIMWQTGLLGYEENRHDVFHRTDFQSQFALPSGKVGYVFHPTMRECAGLEANGRLVDVL